MPAESFYNGKRDFFRTLSKDASGDETVKAIVKTINTSSQEPFIKKTVEILKAKSPDKLSFMKNLFGVACKNVKYLADEPGHEVVYTPALLMRMGKGDCKKFTVFIASVLKAAGYSAIPKVVKYDSRNDWEHIYVISEDQTHPNGYYTLDPVNHCNFDSEVKYAQARLNYLNGTNSEIMEGNKLSVMGNLSTDLTASKMMGEVNKSANSLLEDLSAITGVGCYNKSYHNREALRGLRDEYINGINDENMINGDEDSITGISGIGIARRKEQGSSRGSKTKVAKEQKRDKRKKVFHKLKKFAPAMASTRLAFLSLVKLGGALQKVKGLHINLASKLAQAMQDPVKAKPVLDIWYRFGGEKEALLKAIAQAGKKSMHGLSGDEMLAEGVNGIGVYTAVAAAAVITAATPILVPIIKMLKKDGKVSQKEADTIEAGIDTAENVAMTVNDEGGLTPNAAKALVNSKLIREQMDEDKGGNPATTRDMQNEAAQETPTGDFKEGASSSSTPAPNSDTANIRTVDTSKSVDASLTPVKLEDTPQALAAKSMWQSAYNPTSWIQISLIVVLFGNLIHAPEWLVMTCTSISLMAMIVTSIIMFNNKKQYNG